jgi:hypothetical protein
VIFREEQRFRQWWLWLLVLGIAAVAWWGFVQQIVFGEPLGTNPAPDWLMWVLLIIFGIGFPAFLLLLRLITEVRNDSVYIRFVPLRTRTIAFSEIEHVKARTYSAVREYGGWGIKGWSRNKIAYNVSGNEGVELTLTNGQRVMIGSQRAPELAAAIAAQGVPSQGGQ